MARTVKVHIKELAMSPPSRPRLPRSGHCCSPLPPSHKYDVILFGGYVEQGAAPSYSRQPTAETWAYSIQDDKWREIACAPGPHPEERLVSQAVVVGDQLWVLAGWNPGSQGDGGHILNDVWTLDLNSWQWKQVHTQGEQMPHVSRFQAVAVGSLIYIYTHRSIQDILVLDTSTTPPTLMSKQVKGADSHTPSSRGLSSLTRVGDKLHLFSGAPQRGDMLADLWELHLPSLTWKQLHPSGPSPSPRCAQAAAACGKNIVFFGGAHYSSTGLQVDDALFLYDTEANSWRLPDLSGPLPAARNAADMVDLGGGRLLLHGGWRAFVETYNDTFLLEVLG